MELEDPNLPAPANDWALIGAYQIRLWAMELEHNPATNPTMALATTLLSVVEAQARIIGDLAARLDALEQQ